MFVGVGGGVVGCCEVDGVDHYWSVVVLVGSRLSCGSKVS